MALKNYSTTKDAVITVAEIQAILAKHGAKKVAIEYDEQAFPSEIVFTISVPYGTQTVKLPANIERAHIVLEKQKIDRKYKTLEQAQRVAWRIIKDWLDAQLALLDMEMVTMDQIMLPYFCNDQGQTIYELYNDGILKLEG